MKNSFTGIVSTFLLLLFIAGGFWGCPQYKVWKKQMDGKAKLAEAEQDRLIIIEDAKARKIAEEFNAEAEKIRAKGMAEAMDFENKKLTSTYNQYLFIRTLEKMADKGDLPQIIYIPSSGLVPVMDIKNPKKEDVKVNVNLLDSE